MGHALSQGRRRRSYAQDIDTEIIYSTIKLSQLVGFTSWQRLSP
jgi:hypothetical protein